MRIGRRAVVSFPNFAHWKVRLRLLASGRMPVTPALPVPWYETANIHLCTILDFVELADQLDIAIEKAVPLDDRGCPRAIKSLRLANALAEGGLFLLSKKR